MYDKVGRHLLTSPTIHHSTAYKIKSLLTTHKLPASWHQVTPCIIATQEHMRPGPVAKPQPASRYFMVEQKYCMAGTPTIRRLVALSGAQAHHCTRLGRGTV